MRAWLALGLYIGLQKRKRNFCEKIFLFLHLFLFFTLYICEEKEQTNLHYGLLCPGAETVLFPLKIMIPGAENFQPVRIAKKESPFSSKNFSLTILKKNQIFLK